MEWISVEKNVPEGTLETAENVLITDGFEVSFGWREHNPEEEDNGIIFPEEQLWHDVGKLLNTDLDGWPKVTHWMPLPSPPISKEEVAKECEELGHMWTWMPKGRACARCGKYEETK